MDAIKRIEQALLDARTDEEANPPEGKDPKDVPDGRPVEVMPDDVLDVSARISTSDDARRLAALTVGSSKAPKGQEVYVNARDLRWLLQQAGG